MIPQFRVLVNQGKTQKDVNKVLKSGFVGQGPVVEEFEAALKYHLKFDYGVTVNSCTSAIWLGLYLAGVRPNSYVISTPMTCLATNSVPYQMGAKILWADVDEFGNMDPKSIEDLLGEFSPNVKAILTVDWGGLPCDYDELRCFNVPIVEDAAHAFMATYKGRPITQDCGDFVCYSFGPIKHLTSIDGGLLVTPEKDYQRAKLLRWFGLDRETGVDAMRCYLDTPEGIGFKFHMNDFNAAVGLSNIDAGRWSVLKHRENAAYYDKRFKGTSLALDWPKDRESSFWLYNIFVESPLRFAEFMKEKGIMASQVHRRNDTFKPFLKWQRQLPNLDKFYSKMTALPVGWWLSAHEREYIADTTLEWLAAND